MHAVRGVGPAGNQLHIVHLPLSCLSVKLNMCDLQYIIYTVCVSIWHILQRSIKLNVFAHANVNLALETYTTAKQCLHHVQMSAVNLMTLVVAS